MAKLKQSTPPSDPNDVVTKQYVDDIKNQFWFLSGRIYAESDSGCSVNGLFIAPETGSYQIETFLLKSKQSGYSGLCIGVLNNPNDLQTNVPQGWFPSITNGWKDSATHEDRVGHYWDDFQLNKGDHIIFCLGRTGQFVPVQICFNSKITFKG